MDIIITNPKGMMACYHAPYSIGDIVKIKEPSSCLSDLIITKVFNVKNPLYYPKRLGCEKWFNDYPLLKNDNNEWKIIDCKALYIGSFAILLVNRLKQYVVMCQSTKMPYKGVITVVRKGKKRKNKIELQTIY